MIEVWMFAVLMAHEITYQTFATKQDCELAVMEATATHNRATPCFRRAIQETVVPGVVPLREPGQ